MIDWAAANRAIIRAQHYRIVAVVALQLALVVASYLATAALRLDIDSATVNRGTVFLTLPLLIAVRMTTLGVFRLHQGLWRYVSIADLLQIIKATTVGSLIFAGLVLLLFDVKEFPVSVFVLDWAGNILLLGGVRFAVRILGSISLPDMTPRTADVY